MITIKQKTFGLLIFAITILFSNIGCKKTSSKDPSGYTIDQINSGAKVYDQMAVLSKPKYWTLTGQYSVLVSNTIPAQIFTPDTLNDFATLPSCVTSEQINFLFPNATNSLNLPYQSARDNLLSSPLNGIGIETNMYRTYTNPCNTAQANQNIDTVINCSYITSYNLPDVWFGDFSTALVRHDFSSPKDYYSILKLNNSSFIVQGRIHTLTIDTMRVWTFSPTY